MKKLIVSFDGTWNNPDQEENGIASPTNVVKMHNAIDDEDQNGNKQLKYYHPGVGGEERGFFSSVFGGAFGAGISRHIQSAYHWLGTNYEEGDDIYFFGFSRGAFTVRSIAGFLNMGLLDLRGLSPKETWNRVKRAYEKGYRVKDSVREDWCKPDWKVFHDTTPEKINVKFLGVWDTVGALGIPDHLEILNLFDNANKWRFHNTNLGDHVSCARHAMAIDEIRSSFTVTRWDNAKEHNNAKEVWFPGVHSDVGGGYAQSDLSNGALEWMMQEAQVEGLNFRSGTLNYVKNRCNPSGVMHNSFKGFFSKLRSRPRNIPKFDALHVQEFHTSAFTRQSVSPLEYPLYHPQKTLGVGQKIDVDIFAGHHWNETHVYLEKGSEYTFSAVGEWTDGGDSCDWEGTEEDGFSFGDLFRSLSSFWGRSENLLKKVTRNDAVDLWLTKRVENFDWFTLVGAVANDNGASNSSVANDGSPKPHQYIELRKCKDRAFKIEEPGYLYCFANDAWSKYDNNRGSIKLTIQRVR